MRQAPEVVDRLPRIEVAIRPELFHGVRVMAINVNGRTIELAVVTMLLVIAAGQESIIADIGNPKVFEKFVSEEGKGVACDLLMNLFPKSAGWGRDQADPGEDRNDQWDCRRA